MEDNENNNSELGSNAKETAKKKTKKTAKKTIKLIMSIVKKFVLILLKYALIPLLIVTIVVACIWLIAKTNIHSKIEYITSDTISRTISQATQSTNSDDSNKTVDFSPVAKIEGNDQDGYYIKVDGSIVENIKNSLQEEGIDPKDLGLQSFDCFRTFIETEIMTQFPNVGNGRPENVSNDIITNGCINIQRAQVQEDGTSKNITLKYTSLDNFNSYCENNDSKALDYFTINESGEMLVASYSKTQTSVTTQGDTSFIEVPQGQNIYNINTRNINYKNAVNKYTMPFMFLVGILESSNSEEIALALAELTKNTQITITIEDNIQTTDITEKANYVQKYEGTKQFKYTITKIEQYTNNGSRSTLVNNELATVQASPEAKECTITTQTHTESNTPNIEITYVDSWIAKVEREYTSNLETTNSSSGPTTSENSVAANINDFNINTDSDVAEFMNGKIRAYTQQMEQTPIPNDPNFVSRIIEGSKRDLSVADLKQVLTITNEMSSTTVSKKYTSTNKEVTNNEEKVFEIFDKYKKDFEILDNAQELLYKLLEDNSSTCNFSDTMKYLINKYKDPNYAGELNLSFFNLEDFTSANSVVNSYSLIKEYIHAWEGKPKEEGDQYVIFNDGAGYPTVGWGISINTSGYKQRFIDAGYSTTIGGKVPKEFVDALEDEYIQNMIESINNLNLNLTSYQVAALASRKYNCGNLNGFKDNYNEHWDEKKNEEYYGYKGNDIYEQLLYKNYMNAPTRSNGKILQGLVNRRNSEWLLFMTGYCDKLNIMWPVAQDTTKMTNEISYYDTAGNVNEEAVNKINEYLTNDVLNTVIHHRNSQQQQGPFAKWWQSINTGLSPFQCTWWANNRADQYLELYGTKYTSYPSERGDGGQYYDYNIQGGWFKYGKEPRANSIVSWKQGSSYGHVAYVEAVDSTGIWISHAGSGKSWFGIQKIPLDGSIWPGSGYTLNGYIYLDEPI